jgi:hypothetical protein
LPEFYYADKTGVYNILQPHNIKRFLDLSKNGCLSNETKNWLQKHELTEDSNPVLFYYEYEE